MSTEHSTSPHRVRIARIAAFLAALALTAGFALALRPASQSPAKVITSPTTADTGWPEIERLVAEQRYEEAAKATTAIRERARATGDDEEWARALVQEVQLRTALHGYETSVRFLKDQPWPASFLSRATLELFYAQSLRNYVQVYGYEIGQREKVEARGPVDLKAWSREQIIEEAALAFERVWSRREELGAESVGRFSRYLEPGNYPPRIRGTLRDALSYLFVELLADTSLWRPEEENDLFRLELGELVAPVERGARHTGLADPAVHPLRRAVGLLADLEAWHLRRDEPEAALEARYERFRRLHAAYSGEADRRRIAVALEKTQAQTRSLEWWSVGQSLLAELVQAEGKPDSLVRAREIARAGEAAFPGSIGSRRCEAIVKTIEAPGYRLEAALADGLARTSIEVTHKNVGALYFRAFAVDLMRTIADGNDSSLLPSWQEIPALIQRTPDAQWKVDLPATPDFREHRTFVTPPLSRSSLWVVAASAREDFGTNRNRVAAVNLVLGGLALVLRSHEGGVEVTVLSGAEGEPVAGAELLLVKLDWNKGHRTLERKTTDAQGIVRLPYTAARRDRSYVLIARKGDEVGADLDGLNFSAEEKPAQTTGSLVYTDRSVYRPAQKISWKVVAYHGGGDSARFATMPGTSVTVTLRDANHQSVDSKTVATNGFGSVAGEFVVPPGRLLGAWRVESSLGGAAAVRVEEYKRPTFEVSLKDPVAALRLNRPAVLAGEAKYYFGLPLASGQARWRVTREPVYPWWWWGGWGWRGAPASGAQTIAAGSAALREDGTFEVSFTPQADERDAGSKEITYRYALSADVTDEGGETRSASRSFRLGFVSIEATITSDAAFQRADEPGAMTVLRADLDGTPKAGQGTFRLVTLEQPAAALLPAEQPVEDVPGVEDGSAFETPGDRRRQRWNPAYSPESVMRRWKDGAERARGTVTHDDRGNGRVEIPALAPGAYRLRYETVDGFGAICSAQREFVVAAGQRTPLALPFLLQVERTSVAVGGTARVLAHSGIAGQRMVLELWRNGRRSERREIVAMREPELIEIPIEEKDRGGFGVTLTAVRDHQLMTSTQAVLVPWSDKELQVSFATLRDRLRPGTKETWRVTVKGEKDARIEQGAAELLAYMYDRSLDVFAPHQPPSALALYPWRTGAGWVRGNVQGAGEAWSNDSCLGCVPSSPALFGAQLRFYEGYPIGGMGRRGDFRLSAQGVSRAEAGREEADTRTRPSSLDHLGEKEAKLADNSSPASPAAAAADVPLRSNFAETAFWEPHLLTGPDGSATVEFTVPDSVTSWNIFVHAVTRDLRGGSIKKEARSVKELMVRPYLPRFLREGDAAEIAVVVNDAGERPMKGQVALEIFDPETNRALSSEFGLKDATQPFDIKPGGGATVHFAVRAPNRVGPVAFRVTARSSDMSDGELRPVPILPGRMHLAQSRFATLRDGARRELRFADLAENDDPTRIQEQLVVTLDTQLFYGVLQSLPYLVSYPYECTEQNLNRFLSTGIVSSLYERYPAVARMAKELSTRETRLATWDGADANRKMGLEETPWLEEARGGQESGSPLVNVLDPRIAAANRRLALAKLERAQTSSGGFPWWAGGPPSPYMTLYLLNGFSRALEFDVEVPKDVTVRAWAYLHRHYLDTWVRESMARDCCWEMITFLNYVLSSYPDPSWTGGVFTDRERKEMLDFSFRHWREHSPLLKGYLALTLSRAGRGADARLVFDSVMDSSKTTADEGTFWAAEDRSWLWYNDTIESHAFALRVLMELQPGDPRRDGLVQWLYLNKKLSHWKSTRATAEVIYALVHYLKQEGALGVRESVAVTLAGQRSEHVFEPDRYTGDKTQVVLPGSKIDPATAATVVVEKSGKGFAFASATWSFSTERMPDEDRGDFFHVSRRFFRREQKGGQWTLAPLSEGARIAVGDQLEVQISLRTKHEAEYVHLRDPRAAGFEPENAVSKWKWDLGIAWYEETRDSGANFFFEKLPVGEYTFRYRVRAATAGKFKAAPATVQSMYAPEFVAYSTGAVIDVASQN